MEEGKRGAEACGAAESKASADGPAGEIQMLLSLEVPEVTCCGWLPDGSGLVLASKSLVHVFQVRTLPPCFSSFPPAFQVSHPLLLFKYLSIVPVVLQRGLRLAFYYVMKGAALFQYVVQVSREHRQFWMLMCRKWGPQLAPVFAWFLLSSFLSPVCTRFRRVPVFPCGHAVQLTLRTFFCLRASVESLLCGVRTCLSWSLRYPLCARAFG